MADANYTDKKEIKSNIFTCAACGGSCIFDPETQGLKCEYCDSLYEIEKNDTFEALELDILELKEEDVNNDWGKDTIVFECENCGGETVVDGDNLSKRCVFCSSPQVVKTDKLPGIKPQSVVPFIISADKAKDFFSAWISKRFWAPRKLKSKYSIKDKLNGVYVPYWTYDADTYSRYSGTAGKHYYVTENYSVMVDGKRQMRTRQVQRTRWFPVSGNVSKFYDDILENDGSHMDENIMQNIQPFDLTKLCGYNPKYIVGFVCEKYNQGVLKLWKVAKRFIENDVRSRVNSQILQRADVVGTINIDTDYNNVTYKHMLLPVWLSSYKFGGKVFNFCINGQTGKVQGKVPVSPFKVILAIALAAALIYFLAQWVMAAPQ